MRRILELIGPPLLVLVIVLGLWSLAVRLLAIPAFVLPGPEQVFETAIIESERLMSGFRNTLVASTVGLLAATVVGVLGAIILSTSRVLERALYPWAVVLQTVPVVALAPLFVLWVGPGFVSVVLVAFIIALFPILANTLMGLVSTDPALIDLLRMQGAGRAAIFRKIRLPNSLPYFFTGMRISAGLAAIGRTPRHPS